MADTYNHRVLAMDLDSLEVTVLAGVGEAGWSGDGGLASEASLNTPSGSHPHLMVGRSSQTHEILWCVMSTHQV